MPSDRPPAKILAFRRPYHFPADLDRLRAELDAPDKGFDDEQLEAALACAEAALEKRVPGALDVKLAFANMRAYRLASRDDEEGALAAWAAILDEHPTFTDAREARAKLFSKRGDGAAALAELDQLIQAAPTEASGYVLRGKHYQEAGDDERALANHRRAVQLDRSSLEANYGMAAILKKQGDDDAAKKAYARVAGAPLGSAQMYCFRGLNAFLAGYDDIALLDYEASVALAPNAPEGLRGRGLCRLRLQQLDGAIADFTRVIALQPEDMFGWFRRGEALVSQMKWEAAIADLDRAIALGGDPRGAAHFARGRAHHALDHAEEALADYDAAIEKSPDEQLWRMKRFQINDALEDVVACLVDADAAVLAFPNVATIVHTHARLCEKVDRIDDALAAYDKLIELEPENAIAHLERFELKSRFAATADTARPDLDRAYALAPDAASIRSAYGAEKVRRASTPDEEAEGLRILRSAAEELAPDDANAWAHVAHHLGCLDRDAEAIACLDRAIAIAPDEPDHYTARAVRREDARPWRKDDEAAWREMTIAAVADYDRALELEAHDHEILQILDWRGELKAALGDLRGALRDFDARLEIEPDSTEGLIGRAGLRKLLGDLEGAKEDAARIAAIEDELIERIGGGALFVRFNLDEVTPEKPIWIPTVNAATLATPAEGGEGGSAAAEIQP